MISNKLWKGMLIGAMVGGALTLFDKEVRQQVVADSKKVGGNIKSIIANPKQTVERVQSKVNQITEAYKDLNEDLQFIATKAAEIKELSRESIEAVHEFKQKPNTSYEDFNHRT